MRTGADDGFPEQRKFLRDHVRCYTRRNNRTRNKVEKVKQGDLIMLRQAAVIGVALLVTACTGTAIGPAGLVIPTENQTGYELGGHRIRGVNVTPGTKTHGAVNVFNMQRDGTVTATVHGSTQIVRGRWGIVGEQVCFTFPVRGTECWPYPTAMQIGETRRLTSNRGLTADITLEAIAP